MILSSKTPVFGNKKKVSLCFSCIATLIIAIIWVKDESFQIIIQSNNLQSGVYSVFVFAFVLVIVPISVFVFVFVFVLCWNHDHRNYLSGGGKLVFSFNQTIIKVGLPSLFICFLSLPWSPSLLSSFVETLVETFDHRNHLSGEGKLADCVFIQSNYYQSGITCEREKIKFSSQQSEQSQHLEWRTW